MEKIKTQPSVAEFVDALLDFIAVYVDSTEEEFQEIVRKEEELKGRIDSSSDFDQNRNAPPMKEYYGG